MTHQSYCNPTMEQIFKILNENFNNKTFLLFKSEEKVPSIFPRKINK